MGVYRVGRVESVVCIRELKINEKKCMYEGVVVPTALHRTDAWGMRSDERME